MDQSLLTSVAIVIIAFAGAFFLYYKTEPVSSCCLTASPNQNPRSVLRAITLGESYQDSMCDDEWKNLLSHGLSEIRRHESILASPCICFDSSVFTNCYHLPNLASVYMGAEIASTRDTVPFVSPFSKCGSYGCTNDVNNVIKPENLLPGKNWRFVGQRGSVVIQLPVLTFITAITIIHPPKHELPQGFISSAPHEFCVYGFNSVREKSPALLGSYTYSANGSPVLLGSYKYSVKGLPAQTFAIKTGNADTVGYPIFKFIEIVFRKNHGNSRYTAIYKIEIHGVPLIEPE